MRLTPTKTSLMMVIIVDVWVGSPLLLSGAAVVVHIRRSVVRWLWDCSRYIMRWLIAVQDGSVHREEQYHRAMASHCRQLDNIGKHTYNRDRNITRLNYTFRFCAYQSFLSVFGLSASNHSYPAYWQTDCSCPALTFRYLPSDTDWTWVLTRP